MQIESTHCFQGFMARAKEFDCLNCCKLRPKGARERYSFTRPEAVARDELRLPRNPKENA